MKSSKSSCDKKYFYCIKSSIKFYLPILSIYKSVSSWNSIIFSIHFFPFKLSSEPVLSPTCTSNPCTTTTMKAMNVSDLNPPASYTATNLKWLHTSPICSPTAENRPERNVRNFLTACQNQDVMQDNSVSSTIDTPEPQDSVPCQPPQINAPCLERLLKSTESIISHNVTGGMST